MTDTVYWIWLQRSIGVGRRAEDIISYFGDPETMYRAGKREWLLSGLFSRNVVESLSSQSLNESAEIIDICKKNSWKILTFEDPSFPLRLKQISNAPVLLFVDGDAEILSRQFSLGMVGTRNVSRYGARVADELAFKLSKSGAVIVSGGAIGVDSVCHSAALRAGGETIAFLGCGLGNNYLKTNEPLRRQIAKRGALVTEYIPFEPPSRRSFPIRNRLISGLTLGTVVIEAGIKSGSLITANCALEQGKDVFAVPGNITDKSYVGTNELIRDGAKPVFGVEDILDVYLDSMGDFITPVSDYYEPKLSDYIKDAREEVEDNGGELVDTDEKKKNIKVKESSTQLVDTVPQSASAQAKKIFTVLGNGRLQTDEIVKATGLNPSEVLAGLTELELLDCVESYEGSSFGRSKLRK